MKKLGILVLFAVLFPMLMVSCKEDIVENVKVSLNRSVLTLDKGQTALLTASVTPSSSKVDLKWSSSDNSVATVNADGDVTGVSAGEAVITVMADKSSATCKVTVRPTAVAEVVLDRTSAEMLVGEELVLKAVVLPEDADDVKVTWKSLREEIASVDASGKVKALAVDPLNGVGYATIVAEAGGKIAQCAITVKTPVVHVESVKISKYAETMVEGESFRFEAVVSPDDATDKSVVWESANSEVITIDNGGNAVAVEAGTVEISVRTNDGGKTDKCVVIVEPAVIPVERVEIENVKDGEAIPLLKGESVNLSAAVYPADATDRSLVWSVSESAVLSVTQEGKVTAVGAGTADVIVTTNDGGKTDRCTFVVTVPVASVSLDRSSVAMKIGDRVELIASVLPEDATDKGVEWSSSDDEVVKVEGGVLSALKAGEAVVTVRTSDGGKTAECSVSVAENVYPVTGVTLDKTWVEVTEGEEFDLVATVEPENATDKKLTWESSNKVVATVDNGHVKTYAGGQATITVTTADGGFTAECTIAVLEKVYPVEKISMDVTELDINVGASYSLKVSFTPENATNKNLEWVSSDPTVATVSKYGSVKALKVGETVITATSEDGGRKAECKVTVHPVGVESVSITSHPSGNTLSVGETYAFAAEVYPADATDKTVKWTSSDSGVISVNENGEATAVSEGQAVITVTTNDGGKTDKCTVTVLSSVVHVESVKIEKFPSTRQMNPGDAFVFAASVYPADADEKGITWHSSAPDVITIDNAGNAKALKEGEAVITVKSVDGGKSDSITIKVVVPSVPVTGVEITSSPSDNRLNVGDVYEFKAKVLPENASDKTITWSTSDDRVMTIDASGKAKAVSVGSAIISVKTADGNKEAKVLINVVDPSAGGRITSVVLTAENGIEELRHGKTLQMIPTYSPNGAFPSETKWYSSDETLATVDANGLVKAVSFDYSQSHSYYVQNGYPEVRITHMADNISAVYKLKILPAVPEKIIVSNPPPSSLQLGQSWDLGDIHILPEEAEQKVTIISTYNGEFGGEIGKSFTVSKVGTMSILITAMGEHAQTVHTGTSINYSINVTPIQETSVVMNRTSYTIEAGSEFDITGYVLPSEATYRELSWESSNPSVATVVNGRVKALTAGSASITAKSHHGIRTSCTVNVKARTTNVSVGDYYYSDGTTSSQLLSGKTPVGVVFALADPVGSDPATLEKEHSGCTHGLVVGLKTYNTPISQSAFIDDYPLNVVAANARGAGMLDMGNRTVMNGYSNTKAMKTWGKWTILDVCAEHASSYQLPSSTSGWYFPSLGEIDLLGDSYSVVNEKLKAIDQSCAIAAGAEFWVSTYFGVPTNSYTYIISEGGLAADVRQGVVTGAAMISSTTRYARFIFAF